MTTTPTVIWRRNACGAAESLEIYQGDTLLFDTAASDGPADTLAYVLELSRRYYCADPYSDKLPPDHAVLAMYEDQLA